MTDSNRGKLPTAAAGLQADLHVVESCRTVNGDKVWCTFLGYPKTRNCWRDVSSDFPPTSESASPLFDHKTRVRLTVSLLEGEPTQPVLMGRPPPARDIRATAPAGAPKSTAMERPKVSGQAAKKARRKEYETKVHTIRITEHGVHEIRGIKRAGVTTLEMDGAPNSGLPQRSPSEGTAVEVREPSSADTTEFDTAAE